ncbi:MAG: hypothetical protein P1P80_02005 [ANME-2 cluster archaeon]|nr:hypothetical protein [ANME-2 cluster archaeon]
MKIRTIMGVLLVLGLVLGSTGVAAATNGVQNGEHHNYVDCPCDTIEISLIAAGDCIPLEVNGWGDGDCIPDKDEKHMGPPRT